ncbi:hypothetical protein A6A04_10170 [Paramagnetospirillum marisnigri]|uniref:Uncharacterized protein n=1 Tax=Paramagnetospirillum marisnigri TaxID=1285242 RepID=A0A178M462_9PROT|nr:hypothetical protein [Paramagnetospirillum marisnigri]OAN43049.1 hypothetical protein A6A04_10170 [Paramagnetospirillum marisnigri]
MNGDTIALPAGLADKSRVLYCGAWLSENRQAVELSGESNSVLREIWVRLPSGRDKTWKTNEPTFRALPGHQVGALVAIASDGSEAVIGMVNFSTEENRIFWFHEGLGLGRRRWLLLVMLALLVGKETWQIIAWLCTCVAIIALTIYDIRARSREKARDLRRLEFLGTASVADAP